jgi:hypothetical protein
MIGEVLGAVADPEIDLILWRLVEEGQQAEQAATPSGASCSTTGRAVARYPDIDPHAGPTAADACDIWSNITR